VWLLSAKILLSSSKLEGLMAMPYTYARKARTICPHCDYSAETVAGGFTLPTRLPFLRRPWLLEVVLGRDGNRTGCVVVVSECPKCFEPSYEHISLRDIFTTYIPQGMDVDGVALLSFMEEYGIEQ